MKKHDSRWKNVWGEVRKVEINDESYLDFVLWAGNHYVRHRAAAEQVEQNPHLYGIIFEGLIEKVSSSMHKGGWFG